MSENIVSITCSNYFVEQDAKMGTAIAAVFSKDIHAMPEEEKESVKTFFDWKADGKRITVDANPRRDRNGKHYYWVGRGSTETSTGFKLPLFDGIKKLIEHSLEGVKINVSLDELMAVADNIITPQDVQTQGHQSTNDLEPQQTN